MEFFHMSNHLILQITHVIAQRRGTTKSQIHELSLYSVPRWQLVCPAFSRAPFWPSAIVRLPHTETRERRPLAKGRWMLVALQKWQVLLYKPWLWWETKVSMNNAARVSSLRPPACTWHVYLWHGKMVYSKARTPNHNQNALWQRNTMLLCWKLKLTLYWNCIL